MIRYLSHSEIDRTKWDECVSTAVFETIYPYSWYLDVVSPGWYALVKNDYEMVMPLTWKRKYGIRMLIQPVLTQQLGVFSRVVPDGETVQRFIMSISPKYLLVDICLNRENRFEGTSVKQEPRYNFELDISDPAGDPEKFYSDNTRRNIRKGKALGDRMEEIPLGAYLDLKFSIKENAHLKRYRKYFERLYGSLMNRGRAGVFGLGAEGELHTAAVLGFSRTRSVYLNGCSTETGKEKRGMFVLMDRMIRMRTEDRRVFDFEGSDIPGIARFFEGFGAIRTSYPRIMRNPFQIYGITS